MSVAIRNPLILKSILSSHLIRSISTQITSHYKLSSSTITTLSSSSFTIDKRSPGLQKLFHKDWLSPNEVVKIFSTANPNSVLTLFDHISNRKDFKPNEALYTVIITKFGQVKNFDGIDSILKLIKTHHKGLPLSDCFFYNVIKIFGNVGGLVDKAVETLFDMPSYHCWPSVKTFNFVLNLLVSSKNYDVVPQVYVGAAKLGVKTDACTLNILIKGLCERGLLEDALQLFDEFPKQGHKPNKQTFSTIMHCMCKKGMVDEAFGLIDRMQWEGVLPDSVTFNVLLSGLQKQGRVEEAMELLDRMRLKGCEPNKGTYQEVLYGLLRARKFVEAKNFVQQMRSKSMIPSFCSYKLLVIGLCEENLVGEVEWVLKSMLLVGFVPRMGMWKTVLKKMFFRQNSESVQSFDEIVTDYYACLL